MNTEIHSDHSAIVGGSAPTVSEDRELLQLAAKAVGIAGEWGEKFSVGPDEVDCTDFFFIDDGTDVWNPRDDDGDALRLAVKLDIDIRYEATPNGPIVECRHEWTDKLVCVSEEWDRPHDAPGAVRRAILRAAAEIGRAMP